MGVKIEKKRAGNLRKDPGLEGEEEGAGIISVRSSMEKKTVVKNQRG